jgi:hypothetical protein
MLNHLAGFRANLRVIPCTRGQPFALRAKANSQSSRGYPKKTPGLCGIGASQKFGIILGYVAASV